MKYLSLFFIDFYRRMGLLTEEENKKFLLERKIAESNDEGVLGGNKVVSDHDDIELALPSAEVDMSDKDIEEQLAKRRRKL